MDIFKEVRERADILKVCNVLGIQLNRGYKAICPFANHKEKTASFSISPSKNIFYCFGCGKKGNSITLVQELLEITPLESARYINKTLGLGLDAEKSNNYFEINKYKQRRELEESFKKWELNTFILLTNYLHLLWKWKTIENLDNELFIEALKNIHYIEYVIDTFFINGTTKEKLWFWKYEKKVVKRIESRIRTFRATGK